MFIFFAAGGRAMWTIFKGFVESTTVLLLLFMFWVFFRYEACGILTPQPGVEPAITCVRRRCLNLWTAEVLK